MRALQAFIALSIAGLLAAEMFIYSPPLKHAERSLSVSVATVTTASQLTTLQLEITHGLADRELRLVAFPLSTRVPRRPAIFVFTDSSYPTANVINRAVQGIYDHLSGELFVRGYGSRPTSVTAGELKDILGAVGDANQRAVVMMTGVLPSNVFSSRVDLLTPWVEAGGLVIWGGAPIGFWTSMSGTPLSITNAPGETGTQRLLGKGIVKYPTVNNRLGEIPSEFASALDLSYQFTGGAVLRDPVLARGGSTLGWYGGGFSSISYLPRGSGGYLIFGGDILDEGPVAVDVARLLLASAIYGRGVIVSKRVDLSQTAQTSTLNWDLPFAAGQGIMFIAFDPSLDSAFFTARTIGQ